MLTIRSAQMTALNDHAIYEFITKLCPSLAKRYPHCLPSFPIPVQEQIVLNIIGRAGRWGITWKSALVAFAEMMLAIAPNFDEQPDICKVFNSKWLDPNRAVLSLDQRISKAAWNAAVANTQNLPLYVPKEWLHASLLDQTTAAIPLVLGDKMAETKPDELAKRALALAVSLGLGSVPDAGLVLTAWSLFYGSRFQDVAAFPWVADIFNGKRAPREIIAMLKYRIILDHERFI